MLPIECFRFGSVSSTLERVLLSGNNISSLTDSTRWDSGNGQLPAQLSSTISVTIFSVLFVISALTSVPLYLLGKWTYRLMLSSDEKKVILT